MKKSLFLTSNFSPQFIKIIPPVLINTNPEKLGDSQFKMSYLHSKSTEVPFIGLVSVSMEKIMHVFLSYAYVRCNYFDASILNPESMTP